MSSSTPCGFIDEQRGLGSRQFDEPVQFLVDPADLPQQKDYPISVLNFICDEDGATAVEYAVMVSLIAATCIAGFQSLTSATLDSFETSADELAQ